MYINVMITVSKKFLNYHVEKCRRESDLYNEYKYQIEKDKGDG